jgi:SAM-dependent methyltransferase
MSCREGPTGRQGSEFSQHRPDTNMEVESNQVAENALEQIDAQLTAHPYVRASVTIVRAETNGKRRLVSYVVPLGLDGTSGEVMEGRVPPTDWRLVFNSVYGASQVADPKFNTAGWNSSYTDGPFGKSELAEWRDQTIQSILALHPSRVLEIGCGTGLLLHALAPRTNTYYGTDLSDIALGQVGEAFDGYSAVLLHRGADEFEGLPPGFFDTVIINSVAQYFPDVDYFLRVLAGAVNVTQRPAAIFLGDLRDARLNRAFRLSVALAHASDEMRVSKLLAYVEQEIASEDELLVSPEFLRRICQRNPRIADCELAIKRGAHWNEMTRFRYDATLFVGEAGWKRASQTDRQVVQWASDWDAKRVPHLLRRAGGNLTLTGIINARVEEAVTAVELAEQLKAGTVADLRRNMCRLRRRGMDPEALWELGTVHGSRMRATCGHDSEGLTFDAHFEALPDAGEMTSGWRRPVAASESTEALHCSADANEWLGEPSTWRRLVSQPSDARLRLLLAHSIRSYLKGQLPDKSLPGSIVIIDSIPVTSTGDVDVTALPHPAGMRWRSGR